MSYRKILYVIVAFFCAFMISSFVRAKLAGNMGIVNPVSNTLVEIEKDLHDFKSIPHNEPVGVYFKYKNVGDEPLQISEVVSPCGCTVPKWSTMELSSGKVDSLWVVFDAAQTGLFSRSVHVYSNAEGSPHVFYIRGEVLSDVVSE